jgi:hypothetical protein
MWSDIRELCQDPVEDFTHPAQVFLKLVHVALDPVQPAGIVVMLPIARQLFGVERRSDDVHPARKSVVNAVGYLVADRADLRFNASELAVDLAEGDPEPTEPDRSKRRNGNEQLLGVADVLRDVVEPLRYGRTMM